MKILKLHFNNIQSLKGIHTIDFEKSPFDRVGLFAITGATGAGKSTILDIITLALFNQVPRFGKISNKSMEHDGSIMTQFTNEAFAEIEYEAGNKRYRSTWTIHKAKSGRLQEYSMKLAMLPTGEYFDLNKSKVPDKNEEIIGLNYDQFVRSILLSQGEFAKFLKSDGKDRAMLLEEITGTQIYREIGKATFQKSKLKLTELSQWREKALGVKSLSDDERDTLMEKAKSNETLISLYFSEIRTRAELRSKIENIHKQQHHLHLLNIEAQKINDSLLQFEPKIEILNRHKSLEPFYGDLKEIEFEEKRISELQLELKQSKSQIEAAKLTLHNAIENMSKLVRQQVDEKNFLDVMRAFQLRVTTLDNQLKSLIENGSQYKNQYSNLLAQFPIKEIKLEIEKISDRKKQEIFFTTTIEALKKAAPNLVDDIETIKTKVSKWRNELAKYQVTLNIISQVEILQLDIENDKKNISSLERSTAEKIEVLKELDEIIKNYKIEIDTLSLKKEEQWRINSLEEQRNSLVENSPCPLCGSLDHPYVKHKFANEILSLDKAIYDINEFLKIQIKKRELTIQDLSTNEGKIKSLGEIINKNGLKINTLLSSIDNTQVSLKSEDIKITINDINTNLQADELELNRIETLSYCEQILPVLQLLIQVGDQYHAVETERKNIYTGIDINKEADDIQIRFTNSIREKEILTSTIEKLHVNTGKSETNILTIQQKILPEILSLGYENIATAQKYILNDVTKNEIIQNLKILEDQKKDLNGKIAFLEKEIENINNTIEQGVDITNLSKEIDTYSEERDKLISENGGIDKELKDDIINKALLGEIREQIRAKEKEVKPWITLNELIGDLNGDKYTRYAQNLSLRQLLQLANIRLAKLTDRYQLEITDIDIDLRVIDHYQGDISRSVKTLSGGESFIVSLALALSLSDMASKNVKLECLFIDEGFGTLDAETLETSLETIEKLQSEGNRMIGIISHVESLKERITTQIKVTKSLQGYATIEVV